MTYKIDKDLIWFKQADILTLFNVFVQKIIKSSKQYTTNIFHSKCIHFILFIRGKCPVNDDVLVLGYLERT